jgi:hypothetical protein
MLDMLASFTLAWLEDRIAVDRPGAAWRSIRDLASMAGGYRRRNIRFLIRLEPANLASRSNE